MKHITQEQLTVPLKEGVIEPGDTFTIEGRFCRNLDWRWWKPWVPKYTTEPLVFKAWDGR